MLILYRYLSAEFIGKTIIASAIINFVMILGNVLRRAMQYVVSQDYPLTLIFKFVLLLLPWLLSFSLPFSVLTATLLIFGRLSADHELTAMKACGVSMGHIIAPFVVIALMFTSVSLYINGFLAPKCETAFKTMFTRFAIENPMTFFETETYINNIQDMRIYVGAKDGQRVEKVQIQRLSNGIPMTSLRAEWGEVIRPDTASSDIQLVLHKVRMEDRDPQDPENVRKVQYGRYYEEFILDIPLEKMLTEKLSAKSLSQHTFVDLAREIIAEEPKFSQGAILVELHKRMSLPFACFIFVLVGIPLGIRVQRSEKSIGILVSFLVALVYFGFLFGADALRERTSFYPEMLLWIPNLVFGAAGVYLIWRQNRI
ncbi:MAG: LptF/LptG family permease [Verrucomicrobiae bacterium]|nr:LptF/LptG family permease [Verrucomicrobiae bacterium]